MSYNLSNHRIIGVTKKCGIILYKYSDVARIEDKVHSIYHYPFDYLSEEEIKDAKIVLFSGKTGVGKSTAINVFLNIIKGVKLDSKFRFILIEDTKKVGGQARSQTKGIHLYYLRDQFKKPLIIIDTQGFGDTDSFIEDKKNNKIFEYLFSNIIDHINTICFLVRSIDNRIDPLSKYIITSITSLFAEDICKNFFVLTTYADDNSFDNYPSIIESLKYDEYFSPIIPKMRNKWYYTFDSTKILEDNRMIEDSISSQSFQQFNQFYLEAVINSSHINIKNTAESLASKNRISLESNKLKNAFQDIMKEQKNLKLQKDFMEKKEHQIEMINDKIENTKITMRNTDPEEQKRRMREIFKDIQDLKNGKVDQVETKLVSTQKRHTYCNTCQKNCHNPCDCWFTEIKRCKVFKFAGLFKLLAEENCCEKCGCLKSCHGTGLQRYETSQKQISANDGNKCTNLEALISKNDNNNQELYNNAIDNLNSLEAQKADLEKDKEDLEKQKKDIEKKMIDVKKKILKIILELQRSSSIYERLSLNKNHIKTELDYIDTLGYQLDETGDNEEEKNKKIKEIKEQYNLFKKYKNVNIEEINRMSMDDLVKDIDEFYNSQNINN